MAVVGFVRHENRGIVRRRKQESGSHHPLTLLPAGFSSRSTNMVVSRMRRLLSITVALATLGLSGLRSRSPSSTGVDAPTVTDHFSAALDRHGAGRLTATTDPVCGLQIRKGNGHDKRGEGDCFCPDAVQEES